MVTVRPNVCLQQPECEAGPTQEHDATDSRHLHHTPLTHTLKMTMMLKFPIPYKTSELCKLSTLSDHQLSLSSSSSTLLKKWQNIHNNFGYEITLSIN